MSSVVVNILIVVGLLVCIVAIVYIKRQYKIISDAQKLEKEAKQKLEKRYTEQREYLIESVQVISRAVADDEKLSHTEACMRLVALLKSLAPQLLHKPEFAAINEVYNRTQHIPILGDWKKLSKQEQWKFKQEMLAVEGQYGEQVEVAAGLLAKYDFKQLMH